LSLQNRVAKEREVYLELSGNSSVSEVHVLYGEYDLIAKIEADYRNC
tara:strand:+ start:289 stop:429 length:141 start_codon:yes stop_codon:yes gene_type:complete